MKLLTFLGTSGYNPVTYAWNDGRTFDTHIFPEALVEWLQPSSVTVFLTKEAEAHKNWTDFQTKVPSVLPPVKIPSGKTEEELWEMFRILKANFPTDEPVVLDITHGFRSVPILALLAAAFLQVASDVKIEKIFYGAFEAKNDQGICPVFDLTPFVKLLGMANATHQFIEVGNAEALANYLPEGEVKTNITNIAQGLHFLRPKQILSEADKLQYSLKAEGDAIAGKIPPFKELLQEIEVKYAPFGLANPEDYPNNAKAALVRQLRVIEWLHEKKQYVHTLAMAREWLPSLLCYHFGVNPFSQEEREEMELMLCGGKQGNRTSKYKSHPKGIPDYKQLKQLWGDPIKLAQLRNEVLHTDFSTSAGKGKTIAPQQIVSQLEMEILPRLREIAKQWILEE